MKKILSIIFVLFSLNVFAQDIAIVNTEDVAKGSMAFKKLEETVKSEQEALQNKMKTKEEELKKKSTELSSKSKVLSKEVFEKQVLEFQKEIIEFQEEIKSKENEIQTKLANGLIKLNQEIANITKEILKEDKYKGYSLSMSSVFLISYNEKDNITMEVLKRLNRKKINLLEK